MTVWEMDLGVVLLGKFAIEHGTEDRTAYGQHILMSGNANPRLCVSDGLTLKVTSLKSGLLNMNAFLSRMVNFVVCQFSPLEENETAGFCAMSSENILHC